MGGAVGRYNLLMLPLAIPLGVFDDFFILFSFHKKSYPFYMDSSFCSCANKTKQVCDGVQKALRNSTLDSRDPAPCLRPAQAAPRDGI